MTTADIEPLTWAEADLLFPGVTKLPARHVGLDDTGRLIVLHYNAYYWDPSYKGVRGDIGVWRSASCKRINILPPHVL